MAIYPPGRRNRKHKRAKSVSKKMVASLSLTAMVDMFTVLVVFLLMNYKSTDTVLYIPKEVELPSASETKELKPSHVVTVSSKEILLDKEVIGSFLDVKEQSDWMVANLRNRLVEVFRQDEIDYQKKLSTTLRQAVGTEKRTDPAEDDNRRKITIQADKKIDFLTIKKIMYTVTEAGAREINFAVIVLPPPPEAAVTN
jgi:biopolymer transport protein ExbD